MSQVLVWLLLVITLALQTCGVKCQGSNGNTREKLETNGEKSVLDLIRQTLCQPREALIKVHDEFPEEMQYKIVPSCVPVQRCLGCCSDEACTCMSNKNHTVKLEVRRIYSNNTVELIVLPFVKHIRCSCKKNNSN
ncbi:vascular endothelial growth factor A isoform X2 [Neoarius graeffei]|uniref:vascular endothelial growth factor A isoform X2 n=1 Tax=Neoarius graeffei TaxID=443677 RepID=UPI00298C8441|nr:vascular endothelial growth factor A isoform X2 [Neoarius graeffei]